MAALHAFNFDGGEALSKMGATWFVSYAYYDKIDSTYDKCNQLEKTINNRRNVYNKTTQYHKFWLSKILTMNDTKLSKNKINVPSSKTKAMAELLLKTYK